MANIDAFLRLMYSQGASDLHMIAGAPPCLRIQGDVEPVKYHELCHDELMTMISEITPEYKRKDFEATGDVDFAYELPGVSRYRVNLFQQAHGLGAVFRQIPSKIMTIEQLGLPPIARRFAMMEKGFVLVTGPTGSGKSSTLAAIVDYANKNRRDHIITIEDPIEFKHRRINCLVSHRELGLHTRTYAAALRGALREDPDIILVGEMRDLDTISLALEAAATGHLVFATLHTPSATKTIDRIIDVFPPYQQEQIRVMLASSLKGVISQILLARADGEGRVAAREVMVVTPAVSAIIREGKTHQIYSAIQTGTRDGMCTMEKSLAELHRAGLITEEDGMSKSNHPQEFKALALPHQEYHLQGASSQEGQ